MPAACAVKLQKQRLSTPMHTRKSKVRSERGRAQPLSITMAGSARALLRNLRLEPAPAEGRGQPVEEDEVPDALLCPISYTLFHDPVCLTSGHTYELSSILKFWERRPLANPIGGTGSGRLRTAQMIINFNMRAQVDAFLQGKRESVPDYCPPGWSSSRGAEQRSTQEELDALSKRVEAAAAALDAANATVDDELAANGLQLPGALPRIVLVGELPERAQHLRRYLGVYQLILHETARHGAAAGGADAAPQERRVAPLVINGRYVYERVPPLEGDGVQPPPPAREDEEQEEEGGDVVLQGDGAEGEVEQERGGSPKRPRTRGMLWYASASKYWHLGPAAYVGRACGYIGCYAPNAAVPERLPEGKFMVTASSDSQWIEAPSLRIVPGPAVDEVLV